MLSADDPSANSLGNLLREKVSTLADILGEISADIKSRVVLSRVVLGDIERNYCYLKSKLFELYTWQLGSSRSVESRRMGIEKLLQELNQKSRDEKVECWQNIAELKKEFRSWFKQYKDLMQCVGLVLGTKAK